MLADGTPTFWPQKAASNLTTNRTFYALFLLEVEARVSITGSREGALFSPRVLAGTPLPRMRKATRLGDPLYLILLGMEEAACFSHQTRIVSRWDAIQPDDVLLLLFWILTSFSFSEPKFLSLASRALSTWPQPASLSSSASWTAHHRHDQYILFYKIDVPQIPPNESSSIWASTSVSYK